MANAQSSRQLERNRSNEDSDPEPLPDLKYGASSIIEIFVPVTICIFMCVVSVKCLAVPDQYQNVTIPYLPYKTDEDAATSSAIWDALKNAGVFMVFICIATFGIFACFKYNCTYFLFGYMGICMVSILTMFISIYLNAILDYFNAPFDIFSFLVISWNFSVLGIISIFYKAPKILNQCYTVLIGVVMALFFTIILPEWTGWALLFALVIWDLIAVLCPYGPLRLLVEEAQRRGDREILPGMIYSAMAYEAKDRNDGDAPDEESKRRVVSESEEISSPREVNLQRVDHTSGLEDEDNGVRLGLGDFIFYSVLVSKAATYGDWSICFGCYVSIIVGLAGTLALLAVFQQALPALPISITLGLIAYFLGQYCMKPFLYELTIHQIMV